MTMRLRTAKGQSNRRPHLVSLGNRLVDHLLNFPGTYAVAIVRRYQHAGGDHLSILEQHASGITLTLPAALVQLVGRRFYRFVSVCLTPPSRSRTNLIQRKTDKKNFRRRTQRHIVSRHRTDASQYACGAIHATTAASRSKSHPYGQ